MLFDPETGELGRGEPRATAPIGYSLATYMAAHGLAAVGDTKGWALLRTPEGPRSYRLVAPRGVNARMVKRYVNKVWRETAYARERIARPCGCCETSRFRTFSS